MMKDFALLSHVLPPSPSGQGIILQRLLSDMDPQRYYVISNKNYDDLTGQMLASNKLNAQYYSLSSEPAIYKQNDNSSQPTNRWLRLKSYLKSTSLHKLVTAVRRPLHQLNAVYNLLFRTKAISQQLVTLLQENPVNAIVVCSGDVSNIPAAFLACRQLDITFIPYIFDDYVYQWSGITRFFVGIAAKYIFRRTHTVIVTNEVTAAEYKKRYDLESVIIRNLCPIPDGNIMEDAESEGTNRQFTIVYAGATYAHMNALRNLVKAVEYLELYDIRFLLYTTTPQIILRRNGIHGAKLQLHPHIEQEKVSEVLRQADILFLPLEFDSPFPKIIATASPGKMGEYMALERPILVHAPDYAFISQYFKQNECGMVCDQNDFMELAGALETLLKDGELRNNIAHKARQQAMNDYALDVVRPKFTQFIQSI